MVSDQFTAALAIRDAALSWAQAGGRVHEITPGVRVLQRYDFSTRWAVTVPVRYDWHPDQSEEDGPGAAAAGMTPTLQAHGLTLARDRKLLSLRWNDWWLRIICFRRGAWEAEALQLGRPLGAA